MPRKKGKFERCVKKVRRGGSASSPESVCAASLRRTGWKPQRNPDQLSADALAARLAMGAVAPAGMVALSALELADAVDRGLIDRAAGVLIDPMQRLGEGIAGVANGRRRNPSSGADAMYESFHGKPPDETLTVVEELHEHGYLATLGELCELRVATLSGLDAGIGWKYDSPDQPFLCSNEHGTQLFIRGGDQAISLEKLHMSGDRWFKEHMVIGVCYELTYRTRKQFHRFRLTDYYHELGEETGVQPMLNYDTTNHLLSIVGGQYTIRPEGIVN